MHKQTIFTKTAKGVAKNKAARLPDDIGLLFGAINGKRPVSELSERTGMDEANVVRALARLVAHGYIKVFHEPVAPSHGSELDLDFTDRAVVARADSASL